MGVKTVARIPLDAGTGGHGLKIGGGGGGREDKSKVGTGGGRFKVGTGGGKFDRSSVVGLLLSIEPFTKAPGVDGHLVTG